MEVDTSILYHEARKKKLERDELIREEYKQHLLEQEELQRYEIESHEILNDDADGIEDKDCSWLPNYFVLTKRMVNSIQGFVQTEEQVKDMIRLISENTSSMFFKG